MSIGRDDLVSAITTFLTGQDQRLLDDVRVSLEREIDEAGAEALAALNRRLARTGSDWEYYPRDPLARRIHHVLADKHDRQSTVVGLEHVQAVAGRRLVILANHLSYSDANLVEILMHRCGAGELADRLTVIAGPKVYSSLKRRFSSLCFNSIKTPQSSALSSENAVMNPREVARAARRSIEIACERVQQGDALLVFAEGTRSRSHGMQQTLTAVTRYFDGDVWLMPIGITGTERLFPVGDEAIHPSRIVVRAGAAVPAEELRARAGGDRRLMMDSLGIAIAGLLPEPYRGVYGNGIADFARAREIVAALGAPAAEPAVER